MSQSTGGILTLNRADNTYMSVVIDIKNAIKALKGNGIHVAILWTPGHSEIKGNESLTSLQKRLHVRQKL